MSRQGEVIDGTAEPVSRPAGGAVQAYQEPAPSANPFDRDPAAFALQIRQRGENYSGLVAWLCEHMVVGEDLVQVHVVKRDKCTHGGPPRCTPALDPWHWSDPALSKKGAEKICGLLGLGVRFLGMEDFRKAALRGLTIQDVIIDCELYTSGGQAVSQGTGACGLNELPPAQQNLNNALKKAAKRAHVDAVLRVAGLSGIATEIKRRMPPVDLDKAQGLPPRAQQDAPRTEREEVAGRAYNAGASLTHCPIGKWKGKPWREIDGSYLEWIVRELSDKPDLVKAAAGELSKRRSDAPAGSSSTRTPSPPPSSASPEQQQRAPLDPASHPFDDDIPF